LQMTLGSKLLPVVLKVTKETTALIKAIISFVDSEAGQVTLTFIGIAAAIKGISIVAPLVIGQVIQMAASFQAAAIQSALASTGFTGLAAKSFLVAGGVTKATIAVNAFKIALAKTGIGLAVIAFGLLATEILKVINAQKEFNRTLAEGSKSDVKKQMLDQIETIQKLEEKIAKANPVIDVLSEQFNGLTPTVASMTVELDNANKKLEQLEKRFAEADAEKLAKEFASAVKSLEDTNKALERNSEVEAQLSEEARIQTEFKQAITDLEEKYTGDQLQELKDLQVINRDLQLKGLIIKRNTEQAKKLNDAFKQIGQDIGTGITDALADAVEGTRTLGEAARSILNDIASSLLRLGINAALTGLFGGTKIGGFLGFANGGRPPVGKPSIVGERGPEIFVPRSAGTIIPNNKIGGSGGTVNNINVNVDASAMQSDANENRGKELGVALASAIQSELIKQKRPGGLLA